MDRRTFKGVMMKKYLLLLFIPFIFAASLQDMHKAVVARKNAAASGWSDNFDSCTGDDVLTARSGWDTVSYDTAGGTNYPNSFECQNQQVERLTESTIVIYIVSTHAPSTADYCVQADIKFESDGAGNGGILVRAVRDGENDLNGYDIYLNIGSDTASLRSYNAGGSVSADLDTETLPVVDWSTYQTVKLCIEASGADCILTGTINGGAIGAGLTYTDSTCDWTAAGSGGLLSRWQSGRNMFYDNYSIIY